MIDIKNANNYIKMRTKIKFTEDYIKGVINAVMTIKGAMSRHCYDVEVKTYDDEERSNKDKHIDAEIVY